MNFLQWNNLIASHFFNATNAGKNVHLFITKKEIISLAKRFLNDQNDEDIWDDFLRKLKVGLPGSSKFHDIFDKANHTFVEWNKPQLRYIEGTEILYPPYISHLVFSVLPLIEIYGKYNSNNYYDRLNDFLIENNINQNLKGKLKDVDRLWADLSLWANVTKNGELGYFKEIEFTHTTWKYVGKPFSQCLLPPKSIKRLPSFYSLSELIPKTLYPDHVFQKRLVSYGFSALGLNENIINLIKKGEFDEIGHSIIQRVKLEFNEWTGERHEIVIKDGEEKQIRNDTIVPIKVQFTINDDEHVVFSYRIKYPTEPPIDLALDKFDNIYQTANWSRTLSKQFENAFELRDKQNKWKAVFNDEDIRLLINGSYFQLGSDFWIETEVLSKVEGMYILCKNKIRESIKAWCASSCNLYIDKSNIDNIPDGYSLFFIKGPHTSHHEINQLTVTENIVITLRSGTGLAISYLTFLEGLSPDVEVVNACGTEIVYMEYVHSGIQLMLKKHPDIGGVWMLPMELRPGLQFNIRIKNFEMASDKTIYKIGHVSYMNLNNDNLPLKNKYGQLVNDLAEGIQGNYLTDTGCVNSTVNRHSFYPIAKTKNNQESHLNFEDNILLKWLVGVMQCSVNGFNNAFEQIYPNSLTGKQDKVQVIRKACLRLLDSLGYVDYDYQAGKIYTLPPKLILIPSSEGMKVFLIGGRDKQLISEMFKYCTERTNNQITISIVKHQTGNLKSFIPDSVFLTSNAISEFIDIANRFKINFDKDYILKLEAFVPNLQDYERFVITMGSSESWDKFGIEKKTFNKESLKFEVANDFDKGYTLTECRPSYIKEFGLWIGQQYYPVDKNWGKYLFINSSSEKIKGYGNENYFTRPRKVFYSNNNLAVPVSLPLPKHAARLIIQLSGNLPELRKLNLNGQEVLYNVYHNIPSIFASNFFSFKFNMNIEVVNNKL